MYMYILIHPPQLFLYCLTCRWEDIAEVPSEEMKEEEGGLPPEEEPDIFELEGMRVPSLLPCSLWQTLLLAVVEVAWPGCMCIKPARLCVFLLFCSSSQHCTLTCPLAGMSELDLANHDGSSGEDGSPRPAARGGWEGGHALMQPAFAPGVVEGEAAEKPRVDETADKLDSMMELTFGHLASRHAAGQMPGAWSTLLNAFERCVLLTHRSKFTQVNGRLYSGIAAAPI